MRPPSDDPLASLHQARPAPTPAPAPLAGGPLLSTLSTLGVLVLVAVLIGAALCGAHPGQ